MEKINNASDQLIKGEASEEEKLIKQFESEMKSKTKTSKTLLMIIVLFALILGSLSGYFLSQGRLVALSEEIKNDVAKEEIKVGLMVGVRDEKDFKDSAEGKLEVGGIDGEGSHHLVRPGGESQNVYLTSSVIDLEKFVGHKVKVWGQTFAAQKAGWLMDVGKLKVLE